LVISQRVELVWHDDEGRVVVTRPAHQTEKQDVRSCRFGLVHLFKTNSTGKNPIFRPEMLNDVS
jgi:hypothetical protein